MTARANLAMRETLHVSAELLENGSIEVAFTFHLGDEAVLKAKRSISS
ncbi:MAG: hypothetical protein KIT00_10585 [Rhodospirillales bacterium]|nr:hypothetical protein [Rhodospirillales bacterium]